MLRNPFANQAYGDDSDDYDDMEEEHDDLMDLAIGKPIEKKKPVLKKKESKPLVKKQLSKRKFDRMRSRPQFERIRSKPKLEKKASIAIITNKGPAVAVVVPKKQANTRPAKLTPQQKKANQAIIGAFGEELTQFYLSSTWKHRLQALDSMRDVLKKKSKSITSILPAAIMVLEKSLKEKVLKAFLSSIEFFKALVKYAKPALPGHDLKEKIVTSCQLLIKSLTQKTATQVKATSSCILYLCQEVGMNFMKQFLFQQDMKIKTEVLNRMNLLSEILEANLIQDSIRDYLTFSLQTFVKAKDAQEKKSCCSFISKLYEKRPDSFHARLFSGLSSTQLKYLKTEIERATKKTFSTKNIEERIALNQLNKEDKQAIEGHVSKEKLEEFKVYQNLFGDAILNLCHKKWNKRKEAVENLGKVIESGIDISQKDTFHNLISVLTVGIGDNLPHVYVQSAKVIKDLFSKLHFKLQLFSQEFLFKEMEEIMCQMLKNCGNMNSLIQKNTHETINSFASCDLLGPKFVSLRLLASSDVKNFRQTIGRLQILRRLIQNFPFGEDFPVEMTMQFIIATFQSPNGKVREEALLTVLEVYNREGNVIQTYLRNEKPALMKVLKEKVLKDAANSRTNSAPIQQLAALVRPLGFASENEEDEDNICWNENPASIVKQSQQRHVKSSFSSSRGTRFVFM